MQTVKCRSKSFLFVGGFSGEIFQAYDHSLGLVYLRPFRFKSHSSLMGPLGKLFMFFFLASDAFLQCLHLFIQISLCLLQIDFILY